MKKIRHTSPHPLDELPPRILSKQELEAMARDGSYKKEHFLIQILAENLLKGDRP